MAQEQASMSLAKTYEVDGEQITLSPNIVAKLITGRNDIPQTEVVKFIALCAARKLNPFTGDVYMTAYSTRDGVKTSIVVGKETFTKRAQRNPKFRGMEAGVTVITRNGQIERRPGSMVGGQTEKLIGGWCKVYIEGWDVPAYEEVSFEEYNTGKSLWLSKPATMIRKVAIVHALREAFPDEFQGMYDASEMGVEEPKAPAIAPEEYNTEPEPEPVQEETPEPEYYSEDTEAGDEEDYLFGGSF